MKIHYELETVQDYLDAKSNVRLEGDSRPLLMGHLEARKSVGDHTRFTIELLQDHNYTLCIPIRQFLLELAKHNGIEILATSELPL